MDSRLYGRFRRGCALAVLASVTAFAQDAGGGQKKAPLDQLDIPVSSPKVATEEPPGALRTLIRGTINDQKVMWMSPFRMSKGDAKWWVGVGLVTGGLIAADRTLSRQLPNTNDQMKFSRWVSQSGATYTLYPLAGAYYLIGVFADSPKTKEVGALGAEALTDALIISSVIKLATGRERPELANGNGNWGHWGNYSFPSGHSIMGWSLASLVAHEYHGTKAVPIAVYGLAAAVSASRFSARKHWASDIVAGGAMGWFIGRYVYRRHADPSIHETPLARLRPDDIGPYINPKTASAGVGLTWNLGTR